MKILVINCGSSSLKYQLLNMKNESVLVKGWVERIGLDDSFIVYEAAGREKVVVNKVINNHSDALKMVIDMIVDKDNGVIMGVEEIRAVGHRVVHGGEKFSDSVLISDEVLDVIKDCVKLAPLHNPVNILGIEACQKILPNIPMAAVFDTAFHQTMPAKAFMYPIPYEYYQKYRIRKYGFHGTSHKYVTQRVAELISKPLAELKIISCHLGNGASVTAVKDGKSVENSMGFTPLEGLSMGTRSGNIDPAIIPFLMSSEGLTVEEVENILNKKSGVLGLSGVSSDFRDIENEVKNGNERAQLALDVFDYRVKKHIGSYAAIMGGLDVVVFTAGIGERSPLNRLSICKGLEFLGIKIDEKKNNTRNEEIEISTQDSKVKVFVVPTNEELMIARDTLRLLMK